MKTVIVGLAIIFFAVNAQASTYREERELNMEAKGIQVLDISCGAGTLVIEGKEQQDIKVEAKIEIEGMSDRKAKEFINDKVEISLGRKGTDAYLKSKINDSFWGSKDAQVNLAITLPPNLNLKVDDGSGSTRLRYMESDVSIKDGSGSIEESNTKVKLGISVLLTHPEASMFVTSRVMLPSKTAREAFPLIRSGAISHSWTAVDPSKLEASMAVFWSMMVPAQLISMMSKKT